VLDTISLGLVLLLLRFRGRAFQQTDLKRDMPTNGEHVDAVRRPDCEKLTVAILGHRDVHPGFRQVGEYLRILCRCVVHADLRFL
jgi:hypothetical protein